MLEPIFFKPIYKQVVWGGNNIKSFLSRNIEGENIGESWEISAHSNGISQILNEAFNNENLYELFEDKSKRREIFGNKCVEMDRFPILVKFIDAKENLSIQVHPNDEYARKYENDSGKNEVWYIMDCKQDAKIVYGFKENIKQGNLKESIKDIENNVKYVNVKKGDFISIQAGTIHAICGGMILCEIQQSSDVTYRVYDWNRIGLDGKPRQLHTKKALEVIKLDNKTEVYNYSKFDNTINIYNSKNFNIDLINVENNIIENSDIETFTAYILLEGKGKVKTNNFEKDIQVGDVFLIPAELGEYTINGNMKLMKVYI
mgnify:CR=1 FL=1